MSTTGNVITGSKSATAQSTQARLGLGLGLGGYRPFASEPENVENSSRSSVDDTSGSEAFEATRCMICGTDISHLSMNEREKHINSCLDSDFMPPPQSHLAVNSSSSILPTSKKKPINSGMTSGGNSSVHPLPAVKVPKTNNRTTNSKGAVPQTGTTKYSKRPAIGLKRKNQPIDELFLELAECEELDVAEAISISEYEAANANYSDFDRFNKSSAAHESIEVESRLQTAADTTASIATDEAELSKLRLELGELLHKETELRLKERRLRATIRKLSKKVHSSLQKRVFAVEQYDPVKAVLVALFPTLDNSILPIRQANGTDSSLGSRGSSLSKGVTKLWDLCSLGDDFDFDTERYKLDQSRHAVLYTLGSLEVVMEEEHHIDADSTDMMSIDVQIDPKKDESESSCDDEGNPNRSPQHNLGETAAAPSLYSQLMLMLEHGSSVGYDDSDDIDDTIPVIADASLLSPSPKLQVRHPQLFAHAPVTTLPVIEVMLNDILYLPLQELASKYEPLKLLGIYQCMDIATNDFNGVSGCGNRTEHGHKRSGSDENELLINSMQHSKWRRQVDAMEFNDVVQRQTLVLTLLVRQLSSRSTDYEHICIDLAHMAYLLHGHAVAQMDIIATQSLASEREKAPMPSSAEGSSNNDESAQTTPIELYLPIDPSPRNLVFRANSTSNNLNSAINKYSLNDYSYDDKDHNVGTAGRVVTTSETEIIDLSSEGPTVYVNNGVLLWETSPAIVDTAQSKNCLADGSSASSTGSWKLKNTCFSDGAADAKNSYQENGDDSCSFAMANYTEIHCAGCMHFEPSIDADEPKQLTASSKQRNVMTADALKAMPQAAEKSKSASATTHLPASQGEPLKVDFDILNSSEHPAFQALSVSALKAICEEYGLKPGTKDNMVGILSALWQRMNTSSSSSSSSSTITKPAAMVPISILRPNHSNNNVTAEVSRGEAKRSGSAPKEHGLLGKASKTVSQHEAVISFIRGNPEWLERVLIFQPIDVDGLSHAMTTKTGTRVPKTVILECLDANAIFAAVNSGNGSNSSNGANNPIAKKSRGMASMSQ